MSPDTEDRLGAFLEWVTKYLAFLFIMGVAVFMVVLAWMAVVGVVFIGKWLV